MSQDPHLTSESPALPPVHFLHDRREIGGQAIKLFATFLELSIIEVWSGKDFESMSCILNVGCIGKILSYLLSVRHCKLLEY